MYWLDDAFLWTHSVQGACVASLRAALAALTAAEAATPPRAFISNAQVAAILEWKQQGTRGSLPKDCVPTGWLRSLYACSVRAVANAAARATQSAVVAHQQPELIARDGHSAIRGYESWPLCVFQCAMEVSRFPPTAAAIARQVKSQFYVSSSVSAPLAMPAAWVEQSCGVVADTLAFLAANTPAMKRCPIAIAQSVCVPTVALPVVLTYMAYLSGGSWVRAATREQSVKAGAGSGRLVLKHVYRCACAACAGSASAASPEHDAEGADVAAGAAQTGNAATVCGAGGTIAADRRDMAMEAPAAPLAPITASQHASMRFVVVEPPFDDDMPLAPAFILFPADCCNVDVQPPHAHCEARPVCAPSNWTSADTPSFSARGGALNHACCQVDAPLDQRVHEAPLTQQLHRLCGCSAAMCAVRAVLTGDLVAECSAIRPQADGAGSGHSALQLWLPRAPLFRFVDEHALSSAPLASLITTVQSATLPHVRLPNSGKADGGDTAGGMGGADSCAATRACDAPAGCHVSTESAAVLPTAAALPSTYADKSLRRHVVAARSRLAHRYGHPAVSRYAPSFVSSCDTPAAATTLLPPARRDTSQATTNYTQDDSMHAHALSAHVGAPDVQQQRIADELGEGGAQTRGSSTPLTAFAVDPATIVEASNSGELGSRTTTCASQHVLSAPHVGDEADALDLVLSPLSRNLMSQPPSQFVLPLQLSMGGSGEYLHADDVCSAVSEHVVLSDAWASFASFAPRRADAHDQRVVASSAQEAAGSRMPSPPTAESRMLDTVTSVTDESTHTLVQDSVLAVPDLLLSVGSKRRATRSTGLAQRQTRQTMRARSRAQEAAAAAAAAVAAAASVHHTSILFGPLDEEFGSAWSWQADSRPIDIFAPQPRDMGVRVGDNALEPALGMQTAAHQPQRVTAARRTTRTAPHRRAQFLSDENISHADSLSHSTRFSMPDLSQAPATLAPLTAAQASTSIPAHAGVHAPLFGVEKGHELEASGMSVEEATLAALRPQRMWQREQQQRSVVQEASVVSASTAQASATT